MNREELLKGVDFKVSMKPCYTVYGGKKIEVPDRYVTIRTDTHEPLGVVGSHYKVQQHQESLLLVDKAIQRASGDYTVSHILEGARLYSRFHLRDRQLLMNRKNEESYLAVDVANSYDGSVKFQASVSVWRKICSNGAFGFATEYAMKKMHVKSLYLKELLKGMTNVIKAYGEAYEQFYSLLNDKKPLGKKIISDNFSEKLIEDARGHYKKERSIAGADSAWVQYNAFTRAITRAEVQEKRKQDLTKLLSSLFLNQYQGVS